MSPALILEKIKLLGLGFLPVSHLSLCYRLIASRWYCAPKDHIRSKASFGWAFSRRNLSKQLGRLFAIFLCPTYSPYHSWSLFLPKLLLPCAPEMRLVGCKCVRLQGELPSPPSDTNHTSECLLGFCFPSITWSISIPESWGRWGVMG